MGTPSILPSQVPPLNLASQLSNGAMKPKAFKSLSSVNPSPASHNAPSVRPLGIDFTFNTIKDVKKVTWKDSAPWFREIFDGFCWLAYCENDQMNRDMYTKAEMRARYGPNGAG